MDIITGILKKYAPGFGLELTPEMLRQFGVYARVLLDWNSRVNLTAITKPEEIAVKHFLDSLVTLKYAEIPESAEMIDVGTGAGFPGLPLKIARPDIRLTLLDSTAKRCAFLKEASKETGVEAEIIHGRAEDAGHEPRLRERFDLAAARAVAALPSLCEYCLPFVKTGGVFAALKGPDIRAEATTAAAAIKQLGGRLKAIEETELPNENQRAIVIIEKISQTPPIYPRSPQRIAKKPL